MKRFKLLSIALALLVVIIALVSCDRVPVIKSTEDLFEAIDTKMSKLDSYKIDGEVDMTIYAQGTKMSIKGNTAQIFSDLSRKSCYVYSKSDLTYVIDEKDIVTLEDLKAYYNGNAFIGTKIDAQERKLYSPLSRKDYLEYYEQLSSVSFDDEELYNCQNATYTHNENGSWDMTLSGYSAEFINDYVGDMGFFDEIFDDKVIDMQITLKANSKLHVTRMTLDLIFEDDGNAATDPKVSVIMYFSDHNEAAPVTDELNTENYTEVVDVRLVEGIEHMIEAIKDSEDGNFELSTTQVIGKGSSAESDSISYGVENGKYYYDVNSVIGGNVTYDFSYRDGEVTVTTEVRNDSTVLNSSTATSKQTESEAKSFINGLINAVGYDAMYVNDIEKCEDGRYKVTLMPTATSAASYKSLVSSQLKGSYKGSTHVIYFTIQDGRIMKMESEIVIKYSYWTGFSSEVGEVILAAVVDLA